MPMDRRIIVTMELLLNMQEGRGYFLSVYALRVLPALED
jgi:hypothetical protein